MATSVGLLWGKAGGSWVFDWGRSSCSAAFMAHGRNGIYAFAM